MVSDILWRALLDCLSRTSRNPSNPKDWCQDFWGLDKVSAPNSLSFNNYYLFNSRFWHHLGVQILGSKILIPWPIFKLFMLIWRPLKHLNQSKKFQLYIFYGFWWKSCSSSTTCSTTCLPMALLGYVEGLLAALICSLNLSWQCLYVWPS